VTAAYLFESHPRGSDKAFVLRGLSDETFTDKRRLGDHTLPRLFLPLAGTHNFEHLCIRDTWHLHDDEYHKSS